MPFLRFCAARKEKDQGRHDRRPWSECAVEVEGTASALGSCESQADVDQGVAYNAKSHPTPNAFGSLVATSIESVSSLQEADAAFGPGAPLLGVAEPP